MLYRQMSGEIIPIDEPQPLNTWATVALNYFADAITPGTTVSISTFRNAIMDMGAMLTGEGRCMVRALDRPYGDLC